MVVLGTGEQQEVQKNLPELPKIFYIDSIPLYLQDVLSQSGANGREPVVWNGVTLTPGAGGVLVVMLAAETAHSVANGVFSSVATVLGRFPVARPPSVIFPGITEVCVHVRVQSAHTTIRLALATVQRPAMPVQKA